VSDAVKGAGEAAALLLCDVFKNRETGFSESAAGQKEKQAESKKAGSGLFHEGPSCSISRKKRITQT
jgi:hypothetical protein